MQPPPPSLVALLATSEFRSMPTSATKGAKIYLRLRSRRGALSYQKIAKALPGVNWQAIRRAVIAIEAGRDPGRNGRPRALSDSEQDTLLARIKQETAPTGALSFRQVKDEINTIIQGRSRFRVVGGLHVQQSRNVVKSMTPVLTLAKNTDLFVADGRQVDRGHSRVSLRSVTFVIETLESLHGRHHYRPPRVLNCDEVILVKHRTSGLLRCVTFDLARRFISHPDSGYEYLGSIFITIAANSRPLPTLCILKRKTVGLEDFDRTCLHGLCFTHSKCGFNTKRIFYLYCRKILSPYLKRTQTDGNERALLGIDAHSSRRCPKALRLLQRRDTDVVAFASGSTAFAQPVVKY